jgi:hypothetical protein
MAIVLHIVNTPKSDVREAYEAAWRRLDEQGGRHPDGRLSHTAWLVGDVLHVCDVWESREQFDVFVQSTLGPLFQQVGMELAGEPEGGELLQVVQPD